MFSTQFPVKTAYRLKTIYIVANGNNVGGYKLIYDIDPNTTGAQYSASTKRSLLTNIQRFGKDLTLDTSGSITGGTAYPATTFEWQDNTSPSLSGSFPVDFKWSSTWPSFSFDGADSVLLLGDFDGNGKSDIYMSTPSVGKHKVWLNNGDGTFSTNYQWQAGGLGTGYTIFLGDFNGDAKTDIYMFKSSTGDHIVWLNNGDGTFPTSTTATTWYKWKSGGDYGAGLSYPHL